MTLPSDAARALSEIAAGEGLPPMLPERLLHFAATRPDARAYAFLDGSGIVHELTYSRLAGRAGRIADKLRAAGHGDGARFALIFQPGPSFVTALMGAFLAGCSAVPLAPPSGAATRSRARAILAEADCAGVLTDAATIEVLRAERGANLDRLDVFLANGDGDGCEADPTPIKRLTRPDDIAIIQYTSGSTGRPKGVVVTHAALACQNQAIERSVQPQGNERVVTWLPPEHDMGLIGGLLFNCWRGGATFVLAPASFVRRPLLWLDAISRYRATISVAPNFAYDLCVRGIPPDRRLGLDLSCWRIALNGAEPVRAETMEAFAAAFRPQGFDARAFLPCYGLAEATLLVSGGGRGRGATSGWFDAQALERKEVLATQAGQGRRIASCGPVRTTGGVKIVDPATCVPCAPDHVGEIWIAGDSIGGGYHRRPAESRATFAARLDDGSGPYLRSGDTGFLWQGELYVTGRIKDVVLWHGRTLHAADLEHLLKDADPRLRAERTGVHQTGDGAVVVFVEIASARIGSDGREALARRIWRALMATASVEAQRVLLLRPGSLLWTTSGKLRRAGSLARIEQDRNLVLLDWRSDGSGERAGQRAEARRVLAQACGTEGASADALITFFVSWIAGATDEDAADIDPDVAWADLGLGSLMISEMLADLQSAVGRDVAPDLLFERHTPAALAEALSGPCS